MYPSKSWSPSTSASTCVGVLLRMSAELPRIRRMTNLWSRCLVGSPVSLPVWLASCLASLVMTLAACSCQPPSTSTTTGKNLMPSLSQSWKYFDILSLCRLCAALPNSKTLFCVIVCLCAGQLSSPEY